MLPGRWTTLLGIGVIGVLLAGCGNDDGTDVAGAGEEEQESEQQVAAEGANPFSLVHMAHTFADHSRAWDGQHGEGEFVYVSAPCDFDAPVNNNATNLTTLNARRDGSSSPASARLQPLEFEVEPSDDTTGRLSGTMVLVVCQLERGPTPEDDEVSDDEREQILFDWEADYIRTSEEEIAWDGEFEITSGSGEYEGISGSGQVGGYFTCAFQPETCAELDEFTDVMLSMLGRYDHPDAQD